MKISVRDNEPKRDRGRRGREREIEIEIIKNYFLIIQSVYVPQ